MKTSEQIAFLQRRVADLESTLARILNSCADPTVKRAQVLRHQVRTEAQYALRHVMTVAP